MKRVDPLEFHKNYIKLIGKEWMLITAGDKEQFNTMTASWGGVGYLWNRPVAFIFVRPERFTYEFIEIQKGLTLSFFPEEYRKALTYCGTHSGRDVDKIKESGLTPLPSPSGQCITFQEAHIVIECQKLYTEMMSETNFIDSAILQRWYGEEHGGMHKLYILEIRDIWVK